MAVTLENGKTYQTVAERRREFRGAHPAKDGWGSVIITVHGGLVQSVYTSNPQLVHIIGKVLILDYDIDGVSQEELVTVPYKNSPVTSKAAVRIMKPQPAKIDVQRLLCQTN